MFIAVWISDVIVIFSDKMPKNAYLFMIFVSMFFLNYHVKYKSKIQLLSAHFRDESKRKSSRKRKFSVPLS